MMKKTISKDIIILIALIYNYIINDETELKEWEIKNFLEAVKKELKYKDSEWDIAIDEDEVESYYIIKYLEKDEINKKYKLINLNNLEFWYLIQPQEIIQATLDKDVLSTLFIEKSNLKIKSEYKWHHGIKEIYSTSAKRAQESVLKILEDEGAKNIQIGYTIQKQLDNEKGYSVSYICDKCYEKVDLSIIKEKIKPKEENLELLKNQRSLLQEERKELNNKTFTSKQKILYGLGLLGTLGVSTLLFYPESILLIGIVEMIYILGIPFTSAYLDIKKDGKLLDDIKNLSTQIDTIDKELNGKPEPYRYIQDINSYLVDEKQIDEPHKEQAIKYAIEGAKLFEEDSLNLASEPDERMSLLVETAHAYSKSNPLVRRKIKQKPKNQR